MTVGIVVVSHSEALARGVVELCAQMAPEVTVVPAGGTDDGGIGTSFDLTTAAIAEADSGDGAVILADLGSAEMTAQMALDFLDPQQAERVRLADAPLVEGALAAATTAGGGADVEAVLASAEASGRTARAPGQDAETATPPGEDADAEATVTLPNPLGLHARPAAQCVEAVRDLDARVTVRNTVTGMSAPADSLLLLARLEAAGGTEIVISADGPDAEEAVARIEQMAREGFGEDAETQPATTAPAAPPTASTVPPPEVRPGTVLTGVPASPGLALGPTAHPQGRGFDMPTLEEAEDPAAERQRLRDAQEQARGELEELAARAGGDIFAAHLAILDDPTLDRTAQEDLDRGQPAAWAWASAIETHGSLLSASSNPAFAERGADVRDVGDRVLRALVGAPRDAPPVPAGAVAVAHNLPPSFVPALVEAGAAALLLGQGGRTSHVAVLARNLGLPAVLGFGTVVDEIKAGTTVRVNGDSGDVTLEPDERLVAETRAAIAAQTERREGERAEAAQPGRTADGTRIHVAANASTAAEAQTAVAHGAEGIGLLRTEFLFTERPDLPDEEEQVAALSAVCEAMDGRPVIVRTLDVGGDKEVPALGLDPVRNGFLGVRGLRLSLERPELLRTQLRALLRVATAHRVSVMLPMVTAVDEVRRAREALADARAALDADGLPAGDLEEVGIMVEVPAVALDAGPFAGHVDFFSVGTNDLTAYTMAADRTLPEVADLYRPDHPAVLDLIGRLCEAARAHGVWVGVCGESAGDPDAAEALVRLGVRELSMAPASIPAVKARLAAVALGATAR